MFPRKEARTVPNRLPTAPGSPSRRAATGGPREREEHRGRPRPRKAEAGRGEGASLWSHSAGRTASAIAAASLETRLTFLSRCRRAPPPRKGQRSKTQRDGKGTLA